MKKILGLFLSLLIPVIASAQVHGSAFGKGLNGPQCLGVRNDSGSNVNGAADLTWAAPAYSIKGAAQMSISSTYQDGSAAGALLKAEDSVANSGDYGVLALAKILATPVSQAGDGDNGTLLLNDLNAQYVDGVRRGATWIAANPSISTATSTQIAGANAARRYLLVQNNSAANICVSTTGATLTGIVPSNTNVCLTIAAGASWISPPNACPVTNITAYQTSGGTITSVSVIEGF